MASGTRDDSRARLTVPGGIQRIVTLGVVAVDERIVLECVLDLDRGRLEQSPLPPFVGS